MKHPALLLLGLCLLLPLGPSVSAEDDADEGLWARLKRHDKNGDGKVTREEFGRGGRMFDRLDADGDGAITKAEAAAMQGRAGGGRGGSGRGGSGRGGSGRGSMGGGRMGGGRMGTGGLTLQKLDLDKSGSISKREWAAFFEQADENKDAVLQKEEWQAAVGGGPLKDAGPSVGSKAPSVSAQRLGSEERVNLAAPKRPTVLIFGSWT